MNRQAQAVVLGLLGGALVKASATGMSLRYVKAGLRPLLIIAGILLIATAVSTLWREMRSPPAAGGDEADDHGHHQHGHRGPFVGWLMVLPVLGLLLVGPPALGSYAAGQAGSMLAAQHADSDYPALPAGDPVPLHLLDYGSRAVFDQGRSLTGRNLQLAGFITPGPDGQPVLARIIMTCCAADGRPVKVGLSGNVPAGVAADTWVQVVGQYTPKTAKDRVNNAVIPYLKVASWHEVTVPEQPYE
jgi:uncharacterized repeat protein (TIGR03943 family)